MTTISAVLLGEKDAVLTTINNVRAAVINGSQPCVWIALDDLRRSVDDIGQLSLCFVSHAGSADVTSQRKIIYILDADVMLVPNVFIQIVYQHNLKMYSTPRCVVKLVRSTQIL